MSGPANIRLDRSESVALASADRKPKKSSRRRTRRADMRRLAFHYHVALGMDWSHAWGCAGGTPPKPFEMADDLGLCFDDGHPAVIDDAFASIEHPPARARLRSRNDCG